MTKSSQAKLQTPLRRGRRPRSEGANLSREQLLEVLLSLAASEGSDSLSMRRIASELKVSPRLLYYHVRDKDDLFDLLADTITARCTFPPKSMDWRERIVNQQAVLYQELLKYPGIPHQALVRSTARFDSPHALQVVEDLRTALRESGLAEDQVGAAVAAIHAYFMGHLMLAETQLRGAGAGLDRKRPGVDFPSNFKDGLMLILEGIKHRGATASGA